METIKPFREEEKFTRVHNYLFDVVMPSLKPNAWKVLCFVIRQTIGWKDREGGRKQTDQLSYSQLRKGTGIASDMTLHAALKELLKAKLVKCQKGKHRDAHTYGLNLDYEAITTETVEHEKISTTETVAIGSTEIVVHSTTETVDTKERRIKESIKENGGGNSSLATDNPSPPPIPPAAAVSVNLSPLVAVLVEINEGLTDPFTGVEDLARTLYRNEKTPDDVRHLWNAMQFKNNPAGAFIDAIKRNYTPKTKPVPKPQSTPQEGDIRTVHGVKQVFKRGRWYDANRVSGGNE